VFDHTQRRGFGRGRFFVLLDGGFISYSQIASCFALGRLARGLPELTEFGLLIGDFLLLSGSSCFSRLTKCCPWLLTSLTFLLERECWAMVPDRAA
jgi:hypothetical protein